MSNERRFCFENKMLQITKHRTEEKEWMSSWSCSSVRYVFVACLSSPSSHLRCLPCFSGWDSASCNKIIETKAISIMDKSKQRMFVCLCDCHWRPVHDDGIFTMLFNNMLNAHVLTLTVGDLVQRWPIRSSNKSEQRLSNIIWFFLFNLLTQRHIPFENDRTHSIPNAQHWDTHRQTKSNEFGVGYPIKQKRCSSVSVRLKT